MPEPMRRKVMLRRARTIGLTFLTTVAIAVGGFQGIRALTFDEAAPTQPARQPGVADPKVEDLTDRNLRDMTPGTAAPKVPYLIDLNTRDMTPLPEAITGSLATGRIKFSRFAASPDGSSLAFVGEDEDGRPQIFIAGIDGTGLRQLTRDPRQATSPAWSPDGTRIAYEGYGSEGDVNLFVLDVTTGESRRITETHSCCPLDPQFTPDGSSIIFTGGTGQRPVVRIVPVAGENSTFLIGPGEGLEDAGNASISPDGSLVTFIAGGNPNGAEVEHCGPCRFLANADGTDKRIITGWTASPAGTWSPDGTRIVLSEDGPPPPPWEIRVVDVTTGEASIVAEGRAAIWLDDHTLLVDV
jgi:Tol biopolymer transport system component